MLRTLANNWWLFALRGVAGIVFGTLALVWPDRTLAVVVYFIGAYLFVDGASMLVALIRGDVEARRNAWSVGAIGVLGILAGIGTLVWPGLTALTLLYVVAFWSITTGIFQIVSAIEFRKEIEGEFWMGLGGLISVAFGIVLVIFPGDGLISLVWLMGIWAIVFGVTGVGFGFRLNELKGGLARPVTVG